MDENKKRDVKTELNVVQTECVGCDLCFEEASEAFREGEDGKAYVREDWEEADFDDVSRACEMCPTECIEMEERQPVASRDGAGSPAPVFSPDGGEDQGDDGDVPDVNLEEYSDEEIKEKIEELDKVKRRVEHLEDDYAEDTPTFQDKKERASSRISRITHEYFERSRWENQRVMNKKSYKEVALQPFWPHEMVRNLSIAAFFTGMLILVAGLLPPHLDKPANLGTTPFVILPDWYLYWSFGLLKLGPINPELAFLGGNKIIPDRTYGVLANLVVVGAIAILPFVNKGTARRPVEQPFWASAGVAGVVFAFMISILAIKNLVAEFTFMGFNMAPHLLFDLTFLLPIAAGLVTYPILKSFQKGYMYDLNRRYYRLR